MKNNNAINVFLALGQETRLNIFRLIVRYGDMGLTPTEIIVNQLSDFLLENCCSGKSCEVKVKKKIRC